MSSPDSFIDEVNDEVRRDRLYGAMRRWGWLAVLLVLLIVGGAAWTEWRRQSERRQAEAFGDAVMAAAATEDPEARRAALSDITPTGPEQGAVLAMFEAAAARADGAGGGDAARGDLLALADEADLSAIYRHLALLKVMLAGGTGDAARDGAVLEELAAPGAPYRTMAVEMQALRAVQAGDDATALTLLRALTEDADSTDTLRRRAAQLIVALGASPDPA